MKVAAIIPAYNEEHTIGAVIQAIRDAKTIDEIIVVSDGSTDGTEAVARKAGATVIIVKKNHGKGEAMRRGVAETEANILFFCDADLVGLQPQHVRAIVDPVKQGKVSMSIGLRDRFGIPRLIARLDPLLAIGGERALTRDVFQRLAPEEYHGFGIEISLNEYCKRFHVSVQCVEMVGVTHVPKEIKWGGVRGFVRRVPWLWQIVRVRILSFFPRHRSWHKHQ